MTKKKSAWDSQKAEGRERKCRLLKILDDLRKDVAQIPHRYVCPDLQFGIETGVLAATTWDTLKHRQGGEEYLQEAGKLWEPLLKLLDGHSARAVFSIAFCVVRMAIEAMGNGALTDDDCRALFHTGGPQEQNREIAAETEAAMVASSGVVN